MLVKQRIAVFALGASACLVVFVRLNAREYWALPFLPLGCGVLYFLFPSMLHMLSSSAGICCLNAVIALRYLVSPALLAAGEFLPVRGAVPDGAEITTAVSLMLYELSAVFVVVHFWSKRVSKPNLPRIRKSNAAVICLVEAAGAGVVAVYPQIVQKYTFLLSSQEFVRARISVPGAAELIFQISLLFGALKLIEWLCVHRPCVSSFVLSFLIVTASGCFVPYSSRFGIILPFFSGWLVLDRCYPHLKRVLWVLFPLLLGGLLLISTWKKGVQTGEFSATVQSLAQGLGQTAQSYFGGVTNVALAVRMKTVFAGELTPISLAGDFFGSVMGVSPLFRGIPGTTELFNFVFYGEFAARDQIIPMIGQGYSWFGAVLSPLCSVLSVILMLEFGAQSKRSESVFEVYLYSYLSVRFGLFMMVNASILFAELTNFLVPVWLIIQLNRRITVFPKEGVG